MIISPPVSEIYVHVRRDLADARVPLKAVLEDVNLRIRWRGGIILADRQILRMPIGEDWGVHTFFDEETTTPFEYLKQEWGDPQRRYFTELWGLSDPYQYAEEPGPYDRYCFGAYLPRPFLSDTERALAVIEAKRDDMLYYCQCHSGAVVYTTARRVICMDCGKLHCVLAAPLQSAFGASFTEQHWRRLFDEHGVLLDNEAHIPTIEYQDIYAAEKVWETDVWENMSSYIEFLSRGDPEKVAEWRAGEVSIEDFMEAGWTQAKSPPPLLPAQLSADLFGVDITENAVRSFNAAAEAYGESHTDGDALRRGVLHLFHALELILKVRLEQLSGKGDTAHLNNTAVLSALKTMGVAFAADDLDAIANLRRLRNKLQHGGARYGYREVRVLLARTFTFIDAFLKNEFGEWIGEIAEQPGWNALLTISPIKRNAESEVARRIRLLASHSQCMIEGCPHCKQQCVVREGNQAGFCLYCRRVPRAA